MLFHCMTRHGFASAKVERSGDLIDVNVECGGPAAPTVNFTVCFQAPKASQVEGRTGKKHFALLALSHFNFTKHPAPCTATQLSYEDLVIDDSLILSEAV